MATVLITVSKKGLRRAAVEKLVLVQQVLAPLGDVSISVTTKPKPPASRSERLNAALEDVRRGFGEIETLAEELRDWYENLPDNLRDGEKGEALSEAADTLEDVLSTLQDAVDDAEGVEFPGMYG